MAVVPFETKHATDVFDVIAPDGSGIRVLPRLARGSVARGTLTAGSTSRAIRHQTVDEIWFILSGSAEIWRANPDVEEVVQVTAGDSLTIPVGTGFQFRTIGDVAFDFIMCTMPPWPDADEAVYIEGFWAGVAE